MNHYDFHVHSMFSGGESTIEEIAKRSLRLGYSGICFSEHFKDESQINKLKEADKEITKKTGIDFFIGLEADNRQQLEKLVRIRREYDVLLVNGGDIKLNRLAVETPEVDILTHPESGRKDSGLNHVMAKLAAKNNVAIEINFKKILLSSKGTRARIMDNMDNNVAICRKVGAPMIICSGAASHWQIKDPKVLIAMGCLLGMKFDEAKKSVTEVPANIIKMVKERQNENWIRPGVKVVK